MIDIHSHILNNIDDGAVTLDDSIKIIEEAEKAGFTKIISTSHYLEDRFEKTAEERQKKIDELNKIFPDIEIYIGSEIYANYEIIKLLNENKASSLNNTKYVLFEIPFQNNVSYFNKMIDDLKRKGYKPIMAHPERYEIVREDPKIVEEWKRRGIYMQSNYESLLGKYGKETEQVIRLLLKHKLIDFLGSDVHKTGVYPNVTKSIKILNKIIDENYLKNITEINQNKVLENKYVEMENSGDDSIKKTIFGSYK